MSDDQRRNPSQIPQEILLTRHGGIGKFGEKVKNWNLIEATIYSRKESQLANFTVGPVRHSLDTYDPTDIRLVGQDKIDLSVVQLWLKECNKRHGKDCRHSKYYAVTERPKNLFVYDVQTKKIIEAPEECDYVALSYRWGKGVNQEHSEIGGEDTLARTLRHAIEITRKLGQRYIWIDALCIQQKSPHKQQQIDQMDKIYARATMTIIAGDSVNANSGIKGVEPNSRYVDQITEEIEPGHCLAGTLRLPEHLISWPWYSRGWTYQEMLLSPRLLIFCGAQVVWQCRQAMWCEDTTLDHKELLRSQRNGRPTLKPLPQLDLGARAFTGEEDDNSGWPDTGMTKLRDPRLGIVRPRSFEVYTLVVKEFAKRVLGYENDALNAFAGLSRIFELWWNTRMLMGLPEAFLDMALLWEPEATLQRRSTAEFKFASCGMKTFVLH
ncbi:MAG: hypothetical protein Q9227_004272 [Pyrenula ochraceoflavens]